MDKVNEVASDMAGSDGLAQWVAECMRQAPWTIPFEEIEEWAREVKFSQPPGISYEDANEALADELHAAARRLSAIAEVIYHPMDSMDEEETHNYYKMLQAREDRLESDSD